jgi:hypothetical protein
MDELLTFRKCTPDPSRNRRAKRVKVQALGSMKPEDWLFEPHGVDGCSSYRSFMKDALRAQ